MTHRPGPLLVKRIWAPPCDITDCVASAVTASSAVVHAGGPGRVVVDVVVAAVVATAVTAVVGAARLAVCEWLQAVKRAATTTTAAFRIDSSIPSSPNALPPHVGRRGAGVHHDHASTHGKAEIGRAHV